MKKLPDNHPARKKQAAAEIAHKAHLEGIADRRAVHKKAGSKRLQRGIITKTKDHAQTS